MKLTQISATQVAMFDDRDEVRDGQRIPRLGCWRKWHYNYVCKLRGPKTPAMERGSNIHSELEHTLKTKGEVRDTEYAPYVVSALPHLPIEAGAVVDGFATPGQLKAGIERKLLVERRMWLQLEPGLGWLGYIDLLYSMRGNSMVIWDHKTTSDFRYAKTPEEIARNIQPLSYARWVYEQGHKGMIDLVLFYLKTKPKCPKKPKVLYRSKLVSEAHVRSYWDSEVLSVIPDMKTVAAVPESDTQLLRPNTNACSLYGGCEFRGKCGIDNSISSMFRNNTKGSEMTTSFMEKMKANAAKENAKNAGEGAADSNKGAHTGVLSPDAAGRETPVETKGDEPPKTDEKKKGRKRMTDAEKVASKAKRELAKAQAAVAEAEAAEAKAKADEEAEAEAEQAKATEEAGTSPPKTNGANGHAGFTLYINCYPRKDIHRDVEPTLFEDWFGPIDLAMNETALEKSDKPHYMLLSFGDQKALIFSAVKARLGSVPDELVVNTKSQGASEALSILIPHATRVVQAG